MKWPANFLPVPDKHTVYICNVLAGNKLGERALGFFRRFCVGPAKPVCDTVDVHVNCDLRSIEK